MDNSIQLDLFNMHIQSKLLYYQLGYVSRTEG